LKWHPDKAGSDPEEKAKAEKVFKDISEANEVLGNSDKRRRYDNGEDLEDMQQQQHQGHPFGFPGGFPGGFTFTFKQG